MAYTKHGHHIRGTVKDGPPPGSVVRCGGPSICSSCSKDVTEHYGNINTMPPLPMFNPPPPTITPLPEHFTENTLFKVYDALRKVGMDETQARDAISEMQNAGILFRERFPTS